MPKRIWRDSFQSRVTEGLIGGSGRQRELMGGHEVESPGKNSPHGQLLSGILFPCLHGKGGDASRACIGISESACEQFWMPCWDGWTLSQNFGWRGWGVMKPVIKNQTKQKARPIAEDRTAWRALCHLPERQCVIFLPGPHFPSFGNPKEWKLNRTKIPMGLNYLILHAIWHSSPTRKYLRLKEKLQSYIIMASHTRGCQELVN